VIVRLEGAKMVEVTPLFAGMIADMLTLQQDYTDDDLASFAGLLTAASDILRRHALLLREESRG
jgi:hypothetical protein